jgi:hypothetical protein
LESYKVYIKERILLAAGLTLEDYEDISPPKNRFGNDQIDQIIFNTSLQLPDRQVDVFGLLYKCMEKSYTRKRIRERNERNLSKSTFNRYLGDSKKHIVELIVNNPTTMQKIKKIIGS